MNFTYRQAIVLFVASMLLVMVGLLFKIQHWPNSHILIGAGLMAQLFAMLWLVVVVVKKK